MLFLKGVLLIVAASLCLTPAGSVVVCGSEQWRCADGHCVATTQVCDGDLDCSDGGDEILENCRKTERPLLPLILFCSLHWSVQHETLCPEACRLWPEYCYYALAAEQGAPNTCIFPEIPLIGKYNIEDITSRGDEPADFSLGYSCPPLYNLVGENPRCVSGRWTSAFPSCEPAQLLEECGTLAPNQRSLMANGGTLDRFDQPWHAGIYDKLATPYNQICGGTLISSTIVISAAHCFWRATGILPSENFAVAVGKVYRGWDFNDGGQKSDVSDIKVPPRFFGMESNFQDDLALVILAKPMVLTDYVRPVCVDFSSGLDDRGNSGRVAGWGLTSGDSLPAELLQGIDLVTLDVEQCIKIVPISVRRFLTSDKICASDKNGTKICEGYGGGGLVVPVNVRGAWRWYLRGVASIAHHTDHQCNSDTYTFFTQLSMHEFFIKKYVRNN